jgi:hypothetical protein
MNFGVWQRRREIQRERKGESRMNVSRNLEKLAYKLLIGLVGLTAALVVSLPCRVSAETPLNKSVETCEIASEASIGEVGMKTDVPTEGRSTFRAEDPATGQMPPLPQGAEESVSTADEGLVETEDAGGGPMVDLRRHVRFYMKVTQDESGQISASCSHEETH